MDHIGDVNEMVVKTILPAPSPSDYPAWRGIETIPPELLDGRPVMLKRVYGGRVVSEGFGVWASMAEDAPSRAPIYTPRFDAPHVETTDERRRFADTRRWLKPSRQYCFPEPTHWRLPAPPTT